MNGLATIGLRLISVYLIINSLIAAGGIGLLLTMMESGSDNADALVLAQAISIALPTIVGILLWWLTPKIGKLISKGVSAETPTANDGALVSAGTFLIGLYLFISNVNDMASTILKYRALEYAVDESAIVKALTENAFEVLFGILLMLGHRGGAKLYAWARGVGSNA